MSFNAITARPASGIGAQPVRPVNPISTGTIILPGMNTAFVEGVGECIYNPDTGLWYPFLCVNNPPEEALGPGIDLSGE